ncbi:hypothetical protein NDO71_orf032 [Klebsiella phage vB_KpnM_NDO71]|nr:hypothetical protein NDO71_orf032 [Klebsiella phage vB_KpnM_NDO71]
MAVIAGEMMMRRSSIQPRLVIRILIIRQVTRQVVMTRIPPVIRVHHFQVVVIKEIK